MVKNSRPKGTKTSSKKRVQKPKIKKSLLKTKKKKKVKANNQKVRLKNNKQNNVKSKQMGHVHTAIATEPKKRKQPAHNTVAHKKNHRSNHPAHRHSDQHHLKVAMTPESKVAMQAITSPFKVHENEAKIPDGLGGESFATTDKLRKSENSSVWLKAIRKAQVEFETFSSALITRPSYTYVPAESQRESFPVNIPGALESVYRDSITPVGWPFLAINAPVTPFYSTRITGAFGAMGIPAVADGPITTGFQEIHDFPDPDTAWKNIAIENVYYFTLPGTLIDITRGALGGALNNYCTPVPSSEFSDLTLDPPEFSHIRPITAEEQETWRATRSADLDRFYPMNLSAPMQVYRVLDFTFEIPGANPSSSVEKFNVTELVEAMKVVHPELNNEELIKAVGTIASSDYDMSRYRAQVITPLAGVTDWKDFSSSLGTTLCNASDFVIYPSPTNVKSPNTTLAVRPRKRTRNPDIEDCDEYQGFVVPKKLKDIKEPVTHDDNSYPRAQSNTAGEVKSIYVESDFTYSEGHNGIQTVENLDTVKCTTWEGNGAQTAPYYRVDKQELTTISAEVKFQGSLVASRRTIGFGMKLFSTEAAITANGRIAGGELPISLVTELLNYQSTPLLFPNGTLDYPPDPIWAPTPDKMSEWTAKIESRLEDYNAYRAIDGCTVRYNPLQTEAQTKFVYTKGGIQMNVEPVQIETRTRDGFYNNDRYTALAGVSVALPQVYEPASDGSEMVPMMMFSPADPIFIDGADTENTDSLDGMFFQCVLHTENHTTNQFPLCTEESIYDPNWDLYCRICSEPENFPVVVEGHSFSSFFRKVTAVTETAIKFGAKAIEVGEVMLPLLSML